MTTIKVALPKNFKNLFTISQLDEIKKAKEDGYGVIAPETLSIAAGVPAKDIIAASAEFCCNAESTALENGIDIWIEMLFSRETRSGEQLIRKSIYLSDAWQIPRMEQADFYGSLEIFEKI